MKIDRLFKLTLSTLFAKLADENLEIFCFLFLVHKIEQGLISCELFEETFHMKYQAPGKKKKEKIKQRVLKFLSSMQSVILLYITGARQNCRN